MQDFLEQVKKLAGDITAREGCRLYDVEFVGSQLGRVLRVYIDKDDQGGPSIEDCSKVTRGLNEVLDADENLVPVDTYTLEVSTPGLERTLREPWHFEAALGKMINFKTFAPLIEFNPEVQALGKARTVTGTLESFDDKGLKMNWESAPGTSHVVFAPTEQVTKAHMVFVFEEPTKIKPGHPKTHKGSQGAAKK